MRLRLESCEKQICLESVRNPSPFPRASPRRWSTAPWSSRARRASCARRIRPASSSSSTTATWSPSSATDDPQLGKFHGLARSLVANAVTGVTDGFKRELDIVGVGYRAELKGKQVIFALGYSHAVVFDIPTGIDVAIDKQTHITVTGVDRQLVGQVAANIRRLRKPDPYKQKGVRYTGEVLKKKAGKTGAK